jgi:hypothetical protein
VHLHRTAQRSGRSAAAAAAASVTASVTAVAPIARMACAAHLAWLWRSYVVPLKQAADLLLLLLP